MSGTKLIPRKTACQELMVLTARCSQVNDGTADRMYPDRIKYLAVTGPYVTGDRDMIPSPDVFLEIEKHPERTEEFLATCDPLSFVGLDRSMYPDLLLYQFLIQRCSSLRIRSIDDPDYEPMDESNTLVLINNKKIDEVAVGQAVLLGTGQFYAKEGA